MRYIKTIVCLANSRKNSGRCVAGKEVSLGRVGPWIRPVSGRPTAELSEYDRQYQDGSEPRVLDMIEIPFKTYKPTGHQVENHEIDPQYYWRKVGRFSWAKVRHLVDRDPVLWNRGPSSSNGLNDRVWADSAYELGNSLRFIRPEGAVWCFQTEEDGKKRVRAEFTYCGVRYRLVVTDPAVEKLLDLLPDGERSFTSAYLCVSLGEPYHRWCYKLVASVLTKSLVEGGI